MAGVWTCRNCGTRQFRTRTKLCRECGQMTQPKPRAAKTKRDADLISHGEAALLSTLIHGGEPKTCGFCGEPFAEGSRRPDRDHEHGTLRFRGILHPKCNKEIVRGTTREDAVRLLAYHDRVEEFYRHVTVAR